MVDATALTPVPRGPYRTPQAFIRIIGKSKAVGKRSCVSARAFPKSCLCERSDTCICDASANEQSPRWPAGRWLTCTRGAGTGVVAALLAMTDGRRSPSGSRMEKPWCLGQGLAAAGLGAPRGGLCSNPNRAQPSARPLVAAAGAGAMQYIPQQQAGQISGARHQNDGCTRGEVQEVGQPQASSGENDTQHSG